MNEQEKFVGSLKDKLNLSIPISEIGGDETDLFFGRDLRHQEQQTEWTVPVIFFILKWNLFKTFILNVYFAMHIFAFFCYFLY